MTQKEFSYRSHRYIGNISVLLEPRSFGNKTIFLLKNVVAVYMQLCKKLKFGQGKY